MTNQLTTFNFNTLTVRVVEVDGDPWFVAADVLPALGLDTTNGTAHHYRKLDTSERSKVDRIHVGLKPGRPMVIVSESGLYKLAMRSDKVEAKAFQDWVAKEVLPSIRKTGSYSTQEESGAVSTETKAYIEELEQTVKITDCVQAIRGGRTPGTWLHPKLAIHAARWLDVRFSVACEQMIE